MNELLNKYFANTLSDLEKAELFQLLETDGALKEEFVRLQNIIALSGMADKEDDDSWTTSKFNEVMQQADKRKFHRFALAALKYAAVVTIMVSIWFTSQEYTLQKNASEYTCIEAPKGQRVHITLSDGTEAWLSSRTQLKISNQFNTENRIVELDGEGFFSVSKNTAKPFIVKTDQYNIQVTGTQFNVFAYSKGPLFETDLVEGSVFIYNKDLKNEPLYLKPGEKIFSKTGALYKGVSSFAHSQQTKNGIYSFEEKSLKEIITRLELWYDVRIGLTDNKVSNAVFSGKFRQSDDIESILNAIKETGKFNYRIVNEQKIEIY